MRLSPRGRSLESRDWGIYERGRTVARTGSATLQTGVVPGRGGSDRAHGLRRHRDDDPAIVPRPRSSPRRRDPRLRDHDHATSGCLHSRARGGGDRRRHVAAGQGPGREHRHAPRRAPCSSCAVLSLPAESVTHLDFPEQELDLAGDGSGGRRGRRRPSLEAGGGADHVGSRPPPRPRRLGGGDTACLRRAGIRLLAVPVWQWDHPRVMGPHRQASSRPELVRTTGYVERKRAAFARLPVAIVVGRRW